jgi:predicted MFS family arabinose efflux permease
MKTTETPPGRLSGGMVLLLAVGCGLSAANLYYAQPLLHTIASALHAGSGEAGLMITFSQLGYALGLGLLVPVGDISPRRRLVPAVLVVTAVALAASAAAGSIAVLIVLALFAGVGSVAAQILVPLAAELAGEERRGKVVGTVMSGLLLGILLARTVSGLVAGASSWRVVYGVASLAVLLLAATLSRTLPRESGRPHLPYHRLLVSTFEVFKRDQVLRRRALLGSLAFAGFSILWTTLAFLLSGAPYHYGDTLIGLFGLFGAAGALCASLAGRFADRGWQGKATIGFGVATLVAWLPLWLGGHRLAGLVVGIVVLDVGVQGTHVINQSVMFSAAGADRSRANAVYMVSFFAGGAVGSAASAALYSAGHWTAVSVLGACVALAGVGAAAADRLRPVGTRGSGLVASGDLDAALRVGR